MSQSPSVLERRKRVPFTREYIAWLGMRQRCRTNKPKFKYWAGRGITFDPAWSSFSRFLADMGEKPTATHSLDRINPDLGYTKANCRWATREQQAANRRPNPRQLAKTCRRGHPYDSVNNRGHKICSICARISGQASRARRKAAANV